MKRKPTILAVTNDCAALREVRIVMPFSVLREQGRILDYAVTDTRLENVPEDFAFDVLWLQRIEDPLFVGQVVKCVGQHFVYDLDDLLLACPSYVKFQCGSPNGVAYALRQCGALTVTSQRLTSLLERYSGLSLASKAVVCPNGCRFPRAARSPSKPAGILWSSSDYAALTTSRREVFEALSAFAKRHELPIYCFGYLDESFRAMLPRVIDCGFVSFWHHKLILASYPSMIGVAPLETHADRETQDFINGKSDVKLVDFVGFGHPCVCSQALAYVDTDLAVGTKVENTKDAWTAGLEEMYASKWRDITREQEVVMSSRDIEVIALGRWFQAIRTVQMASPVSLKQLKQTLGQSLRLEAFGILSAVFGASPRLGRLKSHVPKSIRSGVKRFLTT
jgi:hypothetical protein